MDYSDTTKTHREVWAERADEVELLAHEYVKGWVASVGKTQGLYLHILLRHIPEEIRKWGDLRVRSSQGLEHCHKNRKRIGLEATNRRKGQRLLTMMVHVTVLAHVRQQLGENQYATEHAKKKATKLRHLLGESGAVRKEISTALIQFIICIAFSE